jgi:DNA-binding transcriptional MocR family regulator
MTNWLPDLSAGSGPLYVRLANRVETDIGGGVLSPGAKLPPQRNLAFDLGITIGTVGRAYQLLRERGLVSGEVGRGTYVLARGEVTPGGTPPLPEADFGTRAFTAASGKLRMDSTAAPEVGQARAIEELTCRILCEHPQEIIEYVRAPKPSWLEAGRRWLATGNWRPTEESIVPTLGAHAAILAVIAAVTAPGDRIVFEQLTYSSVSRAANLIGRRSLTVEIDGDGVVPEDFERLCAQQHPKLAFLLPDLHNPTLAIMPEDRRRQIVAIAREYNVWLVEDAIYAALLDHRPASFVELAPERTFHVGGLSKSVAAGIRAGWVACPPHFAPRVLTAYKMLTGGKSFILGELAARLVLSGEADAIRGRVREEIEARGAIARAGSDGYDFTSHPRAPFIWMKLPEPWMSGTFKNASAQEGVLIDDEDEYKCGRMDRIFHRVRIGFSAPASREQVAEGFAKLRSLLDNPTSGYDRYG